MSTFSEREQIDFPYVEITVRYEAPDSLRYFLLSLMKQYAGLRKIREIVSFASYQASSPDNWSENDYMENEVKEMLGNCQWSYIYDIIEEFYKCIEARPKLEFSKKINGFFMANGIGWKFKDGLIIVRGNNETEELAKEALQKLSLSGMPSSLKEIKEAIQDLSKRTEPDITGAVQHSMAALECVLREITGEKKTTLGALISKYKNTFPAPLGDVVEKIWGFSSNNARHIVEGNTVAVEEAELLVNLSIVLINYLSSKLVVNSGRNPWDR